MSITENLYIWHWQTGGYNSCHARSRDEAIAKARDMAAQTTLTVDETSVRLGTTEELARLDRQYASLFY